MVAMPQLYTVAQTDRAAHGDSLSRLEKNPTNPQALRVILRDAKNNAMKCQALNIVASRTKMSDTTGYPADLLVLLRKFADDDSGCRPGDVLDTVSKSARNALNAEGRQKLTSLMPFCAIRNWYQSKSVGAIVPRIGR